MLSLVCLGFADAQLAVRELCAGRRITNAAVTELWQVASTMSSNLDFRHRFSGALITKRGR